VGKIMMDVITLAVAKKYADTIGEELSKEGFKV